MIDEQYRQLFNSSPDPMWVFDDLTLRILEANEAAVRLYGWSREEFLRLTVNDIGPPEDVCKLSRKLVRKCRLPAALAVQGRHWKRDHTLLYVEVTCSHIQLQGRAAHLVVVNDITERKRAEKALRASEDRLAFALETSRTGAWDLDLVDHTAYHSLEHDRIFGYKKLLPAWTYEMFLEHVLPEDRVAVDKKFRASTAAKGDCSFECRIRRVDGAVRWIWAAGRHRADMTGQNRRMAGIVQDITERKRAEEALRASEEQYRLLFELNPNPMWIFDENTLRFLAVNEAAVKLYGWSREEFLRLTVKDIRPPEEVPKLSQKMVRQRGSRAIFVGKWRHWKKNHTPLDVEVTIGCIQFQGHPARLTVVNDVTERKRVEEALRESEERLAGIVNSAMDAIVSVDEHQRIVMFNGAAERIFGVPARKAVGWPLGRLIPKRLRRAHERHVRKFARSGVTSRQMGALGEIIGLRGDGKEFPIEASISQVEVTGQKVLTVILRDVSERKRAEHELKELNVNLEQRVAERTAELMDAIERLQAIMDTALVGIVTVDRRGTVESLNSAAAQIFGYAPDEILGLNLSRLVASATQGPGEEFLTHYMQHSDREFRDAGREILGRRKDGREVMLELTLREITQHDQQKFIMTVRDITARKRLERELLEVGERERQQLGHDLHDGLGQHLHALYYMAALLQRELKTECLARAREAGRIAKLMGKALDLARSLAHGLQPVNPVPEGLMITLRELAARTQALYCVDCRFECDAPVHVQRHSAATHLYRIAQEAVNNAMKHGKPTRIRIQLSGSPQKVVMRVQDNGVGIRRRKQSTRGMGLHIMQYRADAISGSLLVQRISTGGTEVVCTANREALLPSDNETE